MPERAASLIPPVEENRREFLVTKLAAGFAMAALPVAAQTIATDTEGLVAGEVKIPVSDGEVPGYRAMPAKGKNFPTVLVVQEIFGVHGHIKDICRRFAKLGYFAVATELYARQGDVSKLKNIQDAISQVVSKVPDAQVMSDLDATVEWAQKSGKADVSRLGITGFCWGGRVVWLYSAHSDKLKAGVAWYGQIVGQRDELRPKTVLELAPGMKAPVLGLYRAQDQGVLVSRVERMRAAMKAAGKTAESIVYPDAGHAFFADYRPSYREADAKDGWNRLQAWFKKYGVA